MNPIKINDRISCWKAGNEPLSSDVILIKGDSSYWLYDVGDNEETACDVENITGTKNIILSHFHKDHIGNLNRLAFKELYQSSQTYKYTHTGIILEKEYIIDDGVRLCMIPIASSHSKGCIALMVNDEYAFLGDATYCTVVKGQAVYNASLLYDEIKQLKEINASYFALSHDIAFIHKKEDVICELEGIYSRREKGNPYIPV